MKRILMMLALAAFLVAALSVSALSAFADPDCRGQVRDNNKNCTVDGPGKSEDSGGNAINSNPNVEVKFKDREQ